MKAKLCACVIKKVIPVKPFCGEKLDDADE